mmetsp:Transcript_241/g.656  ORF Transcript_241/g.656 Transcript_241/m.656 type:complete len:207 (+) Transcript_241:1812-2432(+)
MIVRAIPSASAVGTRRPTAPLSQRSTPAPAPYMTRSIAANSAPQRLAAIGSTYAQRSRWDAPAIEVCAAAHRSHCAPLHSRPLRAPSRPPVSRAEHGTSARPPRRPPLAMHFSPSCTRSALTVQPEASPQVPKRRSWLRQVPVALSTSQSVFRPTKPCAAAIVAPRAVGCAGRAATRTAGSMHASTSAPVLIAGWFDLVRSRAELV